MPAEYAKQYRERNIDKIKKYKKEYYRDNKDYFKKYQWEYQEKNRDKINRLRREYRAKMKIKVLTYYGNGNCSCIVCGEDRILCLSIDHINGNGCKHRRKLHKGGGVDFYHWLNRNDYPRGYQTLCMNCQFIKKHGGCLEGVKNANTKH